MLCLYQITESLFQELFKDLGLLTSFDSRWHERNKGKKQYSEHLKPEVKPSLSRQVREPRPGVSVLITVYLVCKGFLHSIGTYSVQTKKSGREMTK